jgi:hypothetical protein
MKQHIQIKKNSHLKVVINFSYTRFRYVTTNERKKQEFTSVVIGIVFVTDSQSSMSLSEVICFSCSFQFVLCHSFTIYRKEEPGLYNETEGVEGCRATYTYIHLCVSRL